MTEKSSVSRRRFLSGGVLAAGAGASTLAMPGIARAQQAVTLKMQTSWPSSDVFQDMAKQYVERVEEMSNGRLKIDLLPAGAVVGAFQVQDACSDGIIDCAHTVSVYWYGKHKAASMFGTGPVFGGSASDMLSWFYAGGGQELHKELVQDILGLNVISFYGFPMPAQPLGWFKKDITSADDMKGLKYRTVGLAADLMQAMGVSVTQLPGGEIVPAMERGVIDAFEFNNPTSDMRFGAQDVAKNYMLSSYHQASESFDEPVFERPSKAPGRRRQRDPYAGFDPRSPARGLGPDDHRSGEGRVHEENHGQSARMDRARVLLPADELARLQAGV